MRHHIVRCSVVAAVFCGIGLCWAYTSGPPAGGTGAIGIGGFPAEPKCEDCHKPPSGGGGTDGLMLLRYMSGLTGFYVPGLTYRMVVRLSSEGADTSGTSNPKWGFQLTAINAATGMRAGTMVVPPGSPLQIKDATGAWAGSRRQYLSHTSASTFPDAPGPVEWHFDWVAPAFDEGKIYFFAQGVAADGDGDTTNDDTFTLVDSFVAGSPTSVPGSTHDVALSLDVPRPNPSRRGATFSYALPRAGSVTMAVFDASGRIVRTLLRSHSATTGQVRWDATDDRGNAVHAGTYFARLTDGTHTVTRSVTIAR